MSTRGPSRGSSELAIVAERMNPPEGQESDPRLHRGVTRHRLHVVGQEQEAAEQRDAHEQRRQERTTPVAVQDHPQGQ